MPPLLQSCVDAHSMPSALSNTNLCAGTKQVFSWKGRLQRIGTAEERREEEEIMAAPGGDGCSSNGYNEKIKYLQGKRPELVNFH